MASLQIDRLITERLILVPYTIQICTNIMAGDFSDLYSMGLKKGISWPDQDVMETLPRIIINLSKAGSPTGFESWMIIKKDTMEIIGDLGFKGFNQAEQNADLGYGIIKEERRKGYAEEAAAALIQWAFTKKSIKEITARCLSGNTGSINLLKKLSFAQVRQDDEMVYWSLSKK